MRLFFLFGRKPINKNFEKLLDLNQNFPVRVSGGPDSLALAFLTKCYLLLYKSWSPQGYYNFNCINTFYRRYSAFISKHFIRIHWKNIGRN